MRSAINNFKVKSLLLSGDYICSDEEGSCYLLSSCQAATFTSEELTAFKTTVDYVVFPVEIALLNQDSAEESYGCYPLNEAMTHCLTRNAWIANTRKRTKNLLFQLACAICEGVWNRLQLRKSVEQCLELDNLWVSRRGMHLMWIKRTKQLEGLPQERIPIKLGQIFYYILYGRVYSKSSQPKMLFYVKKGPVDAVVWDLLGGVIPMNQIINRLEQAINGVNLYTQCPPSRYQMRTCGSPIDRQIVPTKRRSIERTELSIKKSFELVQDRKKPERLVQQRKMQDNSNVSEKIFQGKPTKHNQSYYQSTIKHSKYLRSNILTYSEALRLSDGRISKDKSEREAFIDSATYRKNNRTCYKQSSPDQKSNRTNESINSEISKLLRERAMEAYRNEKKTSIFGQRQSVAESGRYASSAWNSKARQYINSRGCLPTKQYGRIQTEEALRQSMGNRERFTTEPPSAVPTAKQSLLDKKLLSYLAKQSNSQDERDRPINNRQKFQSLYQPDMNHRRRLIKERPLLQYKRPVQDILPKINTFIFHSSIHNSQLATNRSIQDRSNHEQNNVVVPSLIRQEKQSAELTKQAYSSKPFRLIEDGKLSEEQPHSNQKINDSRQESTKEQRQSPIVQNRALPLSLDIPETPSAIPSQPNEASKVEEIKAALVQPIKTQKRQKIKEASPAEYSQFVRNIMNAPLDLSESDSLEVINLTRPQKPVVVIPTKVIQASPIDTQSASKQINDYVDLINIIGYAGGAPYKSVKEVPNLRPFQSVYFIYKRFYRERKRLEKWLIDETNEFTRPGRQKMVDRVFREWLKSVERQQLQMKTIEDNKRIESSIKAMQRKVAAENKANQRIVKLSDLNTADDIEETTLAIQETIRVVEHLVELELSDDMIRHAINILDGLFIISELDGRNVRAVNPSIRKKGIDDLHEYFLEQEAKLPMLKKIYNLL